MQGRARSTPSPRKAARLETSTIVAAGLAAPVLVRRRRRATTCAASGETLERQATVPSNESVVRCERIERKSCSTTFRGIPRFAAMRRSANRHAGPFPRLNALAGFRSSGRPKRRDLRGFETNLRTRTGKTFKRRPETSSCFDYERQGETAGKRLFRPGSRAFPHSWSCSESINGLFN